MGVPVEGIRHCRMHTITATRRVVTIGLQLLLVFGLAIGPVPVAGGLGITAGCTQPASSCCCGADGVDCGCGGSCCEISGGEGSRNDSSETLTTGDERSEAEGLFCLCGQPPKLPATPAGPRVDAPEPTLIGFVRHADDRSVESGPVFFHASPTYAPAASGRAMTTVYRL